MSGFSYALIISGHNLQTLIDLEIRSTWITIGKQLT